jgi:hypothetical protein
MFAFLQGPAPSFLLAFSINVMVNDGERSNKVWNYAMLILIGYFGPRMAKIENRFKKVNVQMDNLEVLLHLLRFKGINIACCNILGGWYNLFVNLREPCLFQQ